MKTEIYIDRLKDGARERFSGLVPSDPLLPKEPELSFDPTISVSVDAYLAGDHLILILSAETAAYLPCSVCNGPVRVPLLLKNLSHSEPIEEIPSSIFDFSELLRSELLLAVPHLAECGGNCPNRVLLQKPLRETKTEPHTHFPFSELLK